jgi:hypothetical protein
MIFKHHFCKSSATKTRTLSIGGLQLSADPMVSKQYQKTLSGLLLKRVSLSLDGWNSNILTTYDIEINAKLLQNEKLAAYEGSCPIPKVKPALKKRNGVSITPLKVKIT